ncbi:MAG: 2-succinyl-5-enolpyruvyl-6-hydroxy-3-cyclohexene-1-carboxylic-acid synthase [Proteobacteria bacterium]|nr:MAG: 2-succinyl-5-enolpyruvyl-6-hydroxy-3-cyclohexene-1-carboxylic-acid synthase [Pseudomonadota bacterium]
MNLTSCHITNLWASLTVKTLFNLGVDQFCIAPGSRNAPLTLALADLKRQHPGVQLYSHFDERGLGFFALGLAKGSHRPVAVITTSGTAVPNLYPSVVESYQTRLPLIILSADRPPELLDCGANQAIKQEKLFDLNTVFSQQLDLPSTAIPAQQLVNTVSLAVKQALGLIGEGDPGPVHINCPYREPLYNTSGQENHSGYLDGLQMASGTDRPEPQAPVSGSVMEWCKPGLIIAGGLTPAESQAVLAFSHRTNWPVIADISSQLRLTDDDHILHFADLLLASPVATRLFDQFTQVIQFGGRITSKRVHQWLARFKGKYLIVSPYNSYLDPHRKATQIRSSISHYCATQGADHYPTTQPLIEMNASTGRLLNRHLAQKFNELTVVKKLSESIPEDSALFVGNSLSIRLADMLATPGHGNPVYSNRGASGIDGLLASALGCAAHHPEGLTLLIGDLSLLHDLNSLAMTGRLTTPVVIVVLNNDGGSIFNLLPVDSLPEVKKTFFQCPHGLTFKGACAMFSIHYHQPRSLGEFAHRYQQAFEHRGCTLIEINVPGDQSTGAIRALDNLHLVDRI